MKEPGPALGGFAASWGRSQGQSRQVTTNHTDECHPVRKGVQADRDSQTHAAHSLVYEAFYDLQSCKPAVPNLVGPRARCSCEHLTLGVLRRSCGGDAGCRCRPHSLTCSSPSCVAGLLTGHGTGTGPWPAAWGPLLQTTALRRRAGLPRCPRCPPRTAHPGL